MNSLPGYDAWLEKKAYEDQARRDAAYEQWQESHYNAADTTELAALFVDLIDAGLAQYGQKLEIAQVKALVNILAQRMDIWNQAELGAACGLWEGME